MKLKTALLGIVSCAIISSAPLTTNAYTDNAGVMNHFNYDNTQYLYDYLNANNFRFYNKDGWQDAYLKNDNSLFILLRNNTLQNNRRPIGLMDFLVILRPGYATDKGIEVGMSMQKVIETYGPVYRLYNDEKIYKNTPNTGLYHNVSAHYDTPHGQKWVEGIELSYRDVNDRVIQFFIDKDTKKVLFIVYFQIIGGLGVMEEGTSLMIPENWKLLPLIAEQKY